MAKAGARSDPLAAGHRGPPSARGRTPSVIAPSSFAGASGGARPPRGRLTPLLRGSGPLEPLWLLQLQGDGRTLFRMEDRSTRCKPSRAGGELARGSWTAAVGAADGGPTRPGSSGDCAQGDRKVARTGGGARQAGREARWVSTRRGGPCGRPPMATGDDLRPRKVCALLDLTLRPPCDCAPGGSGLWAQCAKRLPDDRRYPS